MDVVPALAAGCAVVQKADDQGALTILALRRAFIDAGVPEALWAVVAGTGRGGRRGASPTRSTTSASPAPPRPGAGSPRRPDDASSAPRSNSAARTPMIVLDDVDPEQAAADAAYACFSAMGQLCVSIERIYVQRSGRRAVHRGPRRAAEVGRARVRARLRQRLRIARERRPARARRGPPRRRRREGRRRCSSAAAPAPRSARGSSSPRCSPASRPRCACYAEETFGAVASLYLVDSEEEAILAANASEYGLNASVLTRSRRRGRRVADALEAGSVNINEGYRGTFGSRRRPHGRREGVGPRSAQRARGTAAVRRPRHGRRRRPGSSPCRAPAGTSA